MEAALLSDAVMVKEVRPVKATEMVVKVRLAGPVGEVVSTDLELVTPEIAFT